MANLEGQELAARYDWSILNRQATFATLNTSWGENLDEYQGVLPDNYGHYVIDSMWNRTTVRKIYGPLTSADWQQEKSFPAYTAVNPAFRIFQPTGNYPLTLPDTGSSPGLVCLTPTPPDGQNIFYEYVSKFWTNTDLEYYDADTTCANVSEQAILQGTLWRFKQAKGFDYSQEFAIYEALVARLQAQDGGGKPRLNLLSGLGRRNAWPINVPVGNWPG